MLEVTVNIFKIFRKLWNSRKKKKSLVDEENLLSVNDVERYLVSLRLEREKDEAEIKKICQNITKLLENIEP